MRHVATALAGLAFLWACGATVYLLSNAGYDGFSTGSTLSGTESVVGHIEVSLVSANGTWVVALLSTVTVIAGLPLGVWLTGAAARRAVTWVSALMLLAFSLIAGFSVGLMYLPGALVLLAAAASSLLVKGKDPGPPEEHRGAM